jgi:hypothetical protein
MDAPPNRGSFNSAHIFGTHVPGGGAVHSIISRLLHRSKQKSLFDQLVRAQQERFGNFDLATMLFSILDFQWSFVAQRISRT